MHMVSQVINTILTIWTLLLKIIFVFASDFDTKNKDEEKKGFQIFSLRIILKILASLVIRQKTADTLLEIFVQSSVLKLGTLIRMDTCFPNLKLELFLYLSLSLCEHILDENVDTLMTNLLKQSTHYIWQWKNIYFFPYNLNYSSYLILSLLSCILDKNVDTLLTIMCKAQYWSRAL